MIRTLNSSSCIPGALLSASYGSIPSSQTLLPRRPYEQNNHSALFITLHISI